MSRNLEFMILTDDIHRYWNVKESNSEPGAEIFGKRENVKNKTTEWFKSNLGGKKTWLGN